MRALECEVGLTPDDGWLARHDAEIKMVAFEEAAKEALEPQTMLLTHAQVIDGITSDDHPVIVARKQMRECVARRLRAKAAALMEKR